VRPGCDSGSATGFDAWEEGRTLSRAARGLVIWSLLAGVARAAPGEPDPDASYAAELASPGRVRETGFWAFTPPRSEANAIRIPPGNPVDHFLLAALTAKGLRPAPPADKLTLLRRATYDLTGLPPTPTELEAFLADESPRAFEDVVDRLLASPRYGERWGRHWLDLVRYSDEAEEAWRYRDWVIQAFNDDMPYDRFIRYQVSGDLLPASQPDAPNADGIIATTMLSLGAWGGIDPAKRLMDIVDDQIDMVGRTFMGLTLSCARCHDHKFDPVTATDYYGLAGIFLSSRIIPDAAYMAHSPRRLRIPLVPEPEVEKHRRHMARVEALEDQLRRDVEDRYAAAAAAELPRTGRYLLAAWEYRHQPSGPAAASLKDFASARELNESSLSRWLEYLGAPRLAGYRLLTEAVQDYDGEQGIQVWKTIAERPWWGVNTTDRDVAISTFALPARSLSIYPSPEGGAVGWRSPIHGSVRIAGTLTDSDPHDGSGALWVIDQASGSFRRELSAGVLPNGGSRRLDRGSGAARLEKVEVQPGDEIYLHISLNRSDAHYDITQVELRIVAVDGPGEWDLTRDSLHSFLEGNPHADSTGNASVWSFHDGAGSHRFSRMPSVDAHLAAWDGAARKGLPSSDAAKAIEEWAGRIQTELEKPDSPLIQDLTGPLGPYRPRERDDAKYLTKEARADLEARAREIGKLRSEAPPLPCANGVEERGLRFSLYPGFQDAHVHSGGDPSSLGRASPRAFPAALTAGAGGTIHQGSGRRELGEWLSSPRNPLAARVMVNRIWQHHFGEGIVRTPSNFGHLGDAPSHPELLDHLASRLVESGWSMKAMHRLIMLSSAYRQSSSPSKDVLEADPENRLLGRMNRSRLDAEALHDGLLSISGRLDETRGGPPDGDPASRRRMIYLSVSRGGRTGFAALFDGADPSIHVETRTVSTVSPQALFLMNHPLMMDAAKSILKRPEVRAEKDPGRRATALYRLLYCRQPTDEELELARAFLESSRGSEATAEGDRKGPDPGSWEEYVQALLLTNDFIFLD